MSWFFLGSCDIVRHYFDTHITNDQFYYFLIYPKTLPETYNYLTLDLMYTDFFESPKPRIMNSVNLSPHDNTYYKVIVGWILSLATRDQAVIRSYHLFLMYALKHHLSIDIGFWDFKIIIYYSGYSSSGAVHMIFCHIITIILNSYGINTTVGNIKSLSIHYDKIGIRQLSLAGIRVSGYTLVFKEHDRWSAPLVESEEDEPVAELEL